MQTKNGFTLLESLVAIAVLTVGVSTAMYVMTQALKVGERTKHKIISANLAQEGLEVIRNIRDRNWFEGRTWYQGIDALTNACLQSNTLYNTIETTCSLGSNLAFAGGQYIMSNAASAYSRTITTQLENSGNPDERLHVISRVSCGAMCSVMLEEYLYNWK